LAATIGTDSGPMIPFSDLKCYCAHRKGQHALGQGKCDNCDCSQFRLFLSLTEEEQEELAGSMCVTPGTANPSQTVRDESTQESGLKDSGKRVHFSSGMVRDVEDDKPGFHFLIPKNIPYDAQMLTRVAEHLRKGAKKYSPRNWEKGNTDEEAERARESALRHMMQWINGETDEDHAAAIISNVIFAETMQYKANQKKGNA